MLRPCPATLQGVETPKEGAFPLSCRNAGGKVWGDRETERRRAWWHVLAEGGHGWPLQALDLKFKSFISVHFLAGRPWASHFASLSLSFFNNAIEMTIPISFTCFLICSNEYCMCRVSQTAEVLLCRCSWNSEYEEHHRGGHSARVTAGQEACIFSSPLTAPRSYNELPVWVMLRDPTTSSHMNSWHRK